MLRKFMIGLVSLAVLAVPTAVASPAQAHVSTCTVAAYNPNSAGNRTLIGKGRWYCSSVSHHEYVASQVDIQYWSERVFWADGWATLGRNKVTTSRLTGTTYATAPCAVGAKRYRTKHTLHMVGAHGVVTKNAYSYGTTINC